MRRRRTLLLAAALCGCLGLVWIGPELLGATIADDVNAVSPTRPAEREIALARCRLAGDLSALDRFVDAQRELTQTHAGDAAAFRVLAEAHLERCLTRDTRRGMAVGKTTHTELPAENARDIEDGLAATDRAIELGDPSADVHRIRSSLLSLRITGFASALAVRPQVSAELRRAEAIDPRHPRIVIARACEKLFAPNRFLGHDPESAERMFLVAAEALELDERPLMFASMCAWLLDRRDDAISLMERAVARNPQNVYTATVLARLRAGESEPFARDV